MNTTFMRVFREHRHVCLLRGRFGTSSTKGVNIKISCVCRMGLQLWYVCFFYRKPNWEMKMWFRAAADWQAGVVILWVVIKV